MEGDIAYRNATVADARKLSVLYKQVYIHTYGREGVSDEFANFITRHFAVERLEEVITKRPGDIIVASYKDNLVGVAELEYDKRAPVGELAGTELNKLYVLDWFCGRGIGYNLLVAAEQAVISKGCGLMWLWVLDSNKRAIEFYKRQRYTTIGEAAFQMEVNSYNNKVMIKELV